MSGRSLSGPATAVAAGAFHACALLAGGAMNCWGINFYGQLGTDTGSGEHPIVGPVGASNFPGGISSISAGGEETCAVAGTAAYCGGLNQYAQLGSNINSGSDSDNPAPFGVPVGAVQQVATGSGFSCTLLTDGTVWCFGDNDRGQLGSTTDNGFDLPHPTPVKIGLPGAATQIGLGPNFGCALLATGLVACWGNNSFGQLGQVTPDGMSATAVIVPGVALNDFASSSSVLTKLRYFVKRVKLRYKKSRKRVLVTAKITIGANAALTPATCSGRVSTAMTRKVKTKTKRYARKAFKLAYKSGVCSFKLSLRLPLLARGKKLSLALAYPGSGAVEPFAKKFTARVRRVH
jgi:hypothetical protein